MKEECTYHSVKSNATIQHIISDLDVAQSFFLRTPAGFCNWLIWANITEALRSFSLKPKQQGYFPSSNRERRKQKKCIQPPAHGI
jgi:hypothetical protein